MDTVNQLGSVEGQGRGAGTPRKRSINARIKAHMDADAELRRRGIRTQAMKNLDALRNFLDRVLPRDRSRPGMTVEELEARWVREYGARPCPDLRFGLSTGVLARTDGTMVAIVRTGRGTPAHPYQYRLGRSI